VTDYLAALASFLITVLAIFALRPVARRIDLVDRPGGRKTHHGEVPIIGGIGMFIGIVAGMGLLSEHVEPSGPLLSAISLMVVLGLLDDRFHLSPWARLPVQATAGAVAAFGTNTFITTLGDPFGLGEITFSGPISVMVTLFFFAAAVNAFNMLDGMDGLAGMAAAVAFIALGATASHIGLVNSPLIAKIVCAAIFGFLIFNAPLLRNNKIRCFMGDAGSTFLGLSLAWICMRVSQSAADRSVAPMTTLWFAALPIYELVWSFVRRLVTGKSPFEADAEHFHHLMIRAGLSVRAAFMLFTLLATSFAAIGTTLERANAPDSVSLLLFVVSGAAMIRSIHTLELVIRFIPKKLRRNEPKRQQAS
jgi:UDP-GlcNAc:undecaprenyl-phosphate/decaprenyl-phosphate GlcNAc-1-phosphate transferase